MRKHIMALIAMFAMIVAAVTIGASTASAAEPEFSTDPANPTLVEEVPEGFNQTSATSSTDDCITTEEAFYERYTPGEDETTHQEYRFGRFVPGDQEVSHLEWSVEKRTRSIDTVEDFKTQYHFRKFTRTQTREWVEGTPAVNHWWNWSPNDSQGPQDYTPGFPTDEGPDGRARGTWQGPHVNGGPMQDTFGTFQTGGGNSPFFHREHISDAVPAGWGPWSEFGPWTPWVPETHTSWEDSDAPLGSPQHHGGGGPRDDYNREWQAMFDGETRQVKIGEHEVEGPWSEWATISANLLTDPTPRLPENTRLVEYRVVGPVKVVDSPATEGYREFYTGPDSDPSRNIEDAAWVLDEAIEGWIRFDERTVGNGDGAEGFTEYVYTTATSGEPCEEEEPPVEEPPVEEPPVNNPPSNPNVPTSIDAGLGGPTATASDQSVKFALLAGSGLLVMLAASMSLVAARRGTEQ